MSEAEVSKTEQNSIDQMKIVYFVLAIIIECLIIGSLKDAHLYGFITKTFVFIFGVAGGYCGALIGDFVRKIACPDMIFTTGGFSGLLKQKLFWFIGPQAIGASVGCILGGGLIVKLADKF